MTASPKNSKRSGNPATRAAATPISQWKTAKPKATQLPSGKYMIYKRVGLEVFLQMGMLPNSLMGFAQRAVEKGRGQEMTPGEITELMGDTAKILEITTFIDKAVCFVSIDPKVQPLPLNDSGEVDETQRRDDLVYIDEIELEDKMFIWQSVTGGTNQVATFRTDAAAVLDSVHRGEDLELPAE